MGQTNRLRYAAHRPRLPALRAHAERRLDFSPGPFYFTADFAKDSKIMLQAPHNTLARPDAPAGNFWFFSGFFFYGFTRACGGVSA